MRFDPGGPLKGALRPPPDKSISHRAALLAAMADGTTAIECYLDSADTRSTLAAVAALGARPSAGPAGPLPERLEIEGVGLRGARPGAEIGVGNAGTLMRLLPGWLAGQPGGRWTIDGDASIRRRPVDRIAGPLRLMGAEVACAEGGVPPLTVRGMPLRGIDYEMPVASAQVKSCLLLAGLLAEGETRVTEPAPSRDHTERMLAASGAEVRRTGGSVTVRPAAALSPARWKVPGDFSSAAFFLVAATLVPGSEVRLEGVGLNPTRTGLLAILSRMGAEVEETSRDGGAGEPTGSLLVRSAALRATEVRAEEVPLAIDELPLVALAGCFAEGTTVIRGAGELRRKESDRIETVCATLRALGGRAEATADGLAVEGTAGPGGGTAVLRGATSGLRGATSGQPGSTAGLRGGTVSSRGDHRIAMLAAVAGVASQDGVEVEGMEAASVSYPGFTADLAALLSP
ncbi:MAG: 3-phosphoshikimate 1-carboxyvinyltransferase [Solirubrobacterales bacterium]